MFNDQREQLQVLPDVLACVGGRGVLVEVELKRGAVKAHAGVEVGFQLRESGVAECVEDVLM